MSTIRCQKCVSLTDPVRDMNANSSDRRVLKSSVNSRWLVPQNSLVGYFLQEQTNTHKRSKIESASNLLHFARGQGVNKRFTFSLLDLGVFKVAYFTF